MSQPPQLFATLRILLPNGRVVEGRGEEWLTAILKVLSVEQQAAVFHAVEKKMVAYETPGNYVLHCEPFSLGAKVNPLGGNGKR